MTVNHLKGLPVQSYGAFPEIPGDSWRALAATSERKKEDGSVGIKDDKRETV